MNDQGFTTVTKAVDSAHMLGGLDPSSIWALMCMVLLAYTWYTAKQATKFQEIRIREAVANAALADAVSRLADKVAQLQILILQVHIGGPSVQIPEIESRKS